MQIDAKEYENASAYQSLIKTYAGKPSIFWPSCRISKDNTIICLVWQLP
jgi:hypothetical protein